MTMDRLNIAVIDDGVRPGALAALTGWDREIRRLQLAGGRWVAQYALPRAAINHGTLCTSLLMEFLARQGLLNRVEITSLSLLDAKNEQTLDAFIAALSWCAEHRMDLALMSVGVKSYLHATKFLPVIERAKPRPIMVAAAANDGQITYPACFRAVIGVKRPAEPGAAGDLLRAVESPADGIDLEAWVARSRVLDACKELYAVEYAKSNSVMAPFAAAHIGRVLLENGRLDKYGVLSNLSAGRPVRGGRPVCAAPNGDPPVVLARYRADMGWNLWEILCALVQRFQAGEYACACIADFCRESVFERSIYALPAEDCRAWMAYYRGALSLNSFLLVAMAEDNPAANDVAADFVFSARERDIDSPVEFMEELYRMVIENTIDGGEVHW